MPSKKPKEPTEKALKQTSHQRDGEEDPTLSSSSSEEYADEVMKDLGPPSCEGKIADLGLDDDEDHESGEHYSLPFGD